MRVIDIDIAIKDLEKEGIDEEADKMERILNRLWQEQGRKRETVVDDRLLQDKLRLTDEVARLQKTVEAQDREEIRQRQAYETIKECFDGFLIELLDKYIAALKEE